MVPPNSRARDQRTSGDSENLSDESRAPLWEIFRSRILLILSAEVESSAADEDVGRFQVAMDDAPFMGPR
jgi:hypothetical protein